MGIREAEIHPQMVQAKTRRRSRSDEEWGNAFEAVDKPIFGTRLVVEPAEMMILAGDSSGAEITPCSTTRLRTKR